MSPKTAEGRARIAAAQRERWACVPSAEPIATFDNDGIEQPMYSQLAFALDRAGKGPSSQTGSPTQ